MKDRESEKNREIFGLKQEIDAKNEELDRNKRVIVSLEADKFKLFLLKSDLESQLTHINSAHEAVLSTLQASLTLKTSENSSLQSEIESLTQQLDSLSAQLFVKTQEITNLREISLKMSDSFDKFQENEKLSQNNLKNEQFRCKLLEEKCGFCENKIRELEEIIGKLDVKKWENRVKELQNLLTEQISAAKITEEKLKNEIQGNKEEKRILEGKISEFLVEIEKMKKEKSEFLKEIEGKSGILEDLKRENNEKNAEISELKGNISQLTAKNSELLHQNALLSDQNSLLSQQIAQISSEFSQKESKISELHQNLSLFKENQLQDSNLKIKLKACEASLDELGLKLHKERAEKKQLLEELSRLSGKSGDLEGELKAKVMEYRAKVAFLEMELAGEKEKVEKGERKVEETGRMLQELTREKDRLQDELTASTTDMSTIGPLKIQLQLQAQQVRAVREELERGVELLDTATESLEGNTTCFACLELLKEAVMCLPCGHVFCQQCKERSKGCKECGPTKMVSSVIRVGLIDTISGKVSYSRQVVNSMRGILSRVETGDV